MGRRRQNDKHLPRRMYLQHGAYYFVPKGGKKQRLDADLGIALMKYAALVGTAWTPRTMGDVIDKYRLEVLPLKRSQQTREDEGRSLDRLKKAFGHMLQDNLTAVHCYQYMDRRRDKNGKPVPVAAKHEIVLLGHVCKKGIRWGSGTLNPASRLEHEKRERRRKVPMEWVDQLRALASPRMRLAIDFAVMVGQRRADTLKLRWMDVQEGGIYVQQGKTKAELLMEHSADLDALLERAKAMTPHIPREYIIRRANGKPYNTRGFSSNWQRLMAKHVAQGGERFTFHDLRSVSANGAETAEEAQARLGHKSIETTKRFYWTNVTKAKPRS